MIPARYSAYIVSKLAVAHLISFLQVENPDLNFISFHPGVVETEMNIKANMPVDREDIHLPADFAVWLASKEASWLKGKFVWSNWDVKELLAKKEIILAGNDLTLQLAGWP